MNIRYLWFVPAVVITISIFILSTSIGIQTIDGISFIDKIQHFVAYAALLLSFLFGAYKSAVISSKLILILFISAVFYGFALEIIQYVFFPDRFFEWLDALSNAAGCIIGYLIYKAIRLVF